MIPEESQSTRNRSQSIRWGSPHALVCLGAGLFSTLLTLLVFPSELHIFFGAVMKHTLTRNASSVTSVTLSGLSKKQGIFWRKALLLQSRSVRWFAGSLVRWFAGSLVRWFAVRSLRVSGRKPNQSSPLGTSEEPRDLDPTDADGSRRTPTEADGRRRTRRTPTDPTDPSMGSSLHSKFGAVVVNGGVHHQHVKNFWPAGERVGQNDKTVL